MSMISMYRETELAIKELQERLKNLQQDERLQGELEFEGKLRTLMGEYSKSLKDVISILDVEHKTPHRASHTTPKASKTPRVPGSPRAPRAVKQYRNPHNGEVIETKGGNHKGLLQWKTQYGGDVVEGWATVLAG